MSEIESLLLEARTAIQQGDEQTARDAIDAALAALREQGEAVLPPLPKIPSELLLTLDSGFMSKAWVVLLDLWKADRVACYRAGAEAGK